MEDMRVRGNVGTFAMESYLSHLTLRRDTGTKLIIEYPSSLLITWVELNYEE